MPEEGATENVDPNGTKVTSAAEAIEPDNIKLKGVSWQDGVDGKSLFTVSSKPPATQPLQRKLAHLSTNK